MKLHNPFGIHEQALQLKARRSEVLASNLANADTPGYKARDFDFRKMLAQEAGEMDRMRVTSSRHIQTEGSIVPPSRMDYRIPDQPSLDGNTVDVQREQIAFMSNTMEYQASLRFINGKITGLLRAIKGE